MPANVNFETKVCEVGYALGVKMHRMYMNGANDCRVDLNGAALALAVVFDKLDEVKEIEEQLDMYARMQFDLLR